MQIHYVGQSTISPRQGPFQAVENVHNHVFAYTQDQNGDLIAIMSEGKLAHEFGLTTDAVKGKRIQDVLHLERVDALLLAYHQAWQGKAMEVESTIGDRTFWTTLSPIYSGGVVREVFGTTTEITERKQMELQLLETEELYRSLVEDTLVGVYIAYVEEAGFVYVNPRLADIFGYTQEEMVKLTAADLVVPEEREVVLTHQERRTKGDRSNIRQQFRGLCKNMSVIDVEVVQKTTTYKGKPAVIGILQDVTERKQAEEMVRKSELLSVVGQMAAGVAHEIRNPLTSLKGFVQLLQSDANGNEEYFRIMLSELNRIEFIISEFLVLAKPQVVFYQRREIRPLLDDIIMLARTQAIMHNIEIVTLCPPQLPAVMCDENQLKQVFLNLMKNAIESMPDGGVVTVAARQEGGRLHICFTDQGCGIPEELLDRLGEPFFTTKKAGTGLGLMVSYKIVAQHGGDIKVNSRIGEGTSFEVQLPT